MEHIEEVPPSNGAIVRRGRAVGFGGRVVARESLEARRHDWAEELESLEREGLASPARGLAVRPDHAKLIAGYCRRR